jgi:hypothetical protein
MTKNPVYLERKEIPDIDLLKKIKEMMGDGKNPKKMKEELPDKSLYMIQRYYAKIRRGVW